MKTSIKTKHSQQRGVALVIVLAMLVLMSGLVVSFVSTASSERASAQMAEEATSSRRIADSTVNLVISQIRQATTVDLENITWSSQPGAIRTYGGFQKSGQTKKLKKGGYFYQYEPGAGDQVFKLYSSKKMVVEANEYISEDLEGGSDSDIDVIENWASKKDKSYVDLNEPLLLPLKSASGQETDVYEARYPIINPYALCDDSGELPYPVTPTSGLVEGFRAYAKRTTTKKVSHTFPNASGESTEITTSLLETPMPVRWLYLLRDGTFTTLEEDDPNKASRLNPIVGRTAFWTDDETCKLNINTASEATPWDTPHFSTFQDSGEVNRVGQKPLDTNKDYDYRFAVSQPARGEVQRYPGHPSTTCLSPVFGKFWGLEFNAKSNPLKLPYPGKRGGPYQTFKEAMYEISPFVPRGQGTSEGATINTSENYIPPKIVHSDTTEGPRALNIARKAPYSSVDELVFKTERSQQQDGYKPLVFDKINPDALQKTRFFLTANSRAPEVNIYGRPRVSIWPVNADYKLRTQYDDLFLFASTVFRDPDLSLINSEKNDERFCLLRLDAKVPSKEVDTTLGNVFTGNDQTSIGGDHATTFQNFKMYRYLQWLAGLQVPSFGEKRADTLASSLDTTTTSNAKIEKNRDQILALIFDYCRVVNMVDTGTTSKYSSDFIPFTPRFYDPSNHQTYSSTNRVRSIEWSGQVTPLRLFASDGEAVKGLGRIPMVSEAAIQFYRSSADAAAQHVRMVLLLEFATTMPGYTGIRETFFTCVREKSAAQYIDAAGVPLALNVAAPSSNLGIDAIPYSLSNPEDAINKMRGTCNVINMASHDVTNGRAFMPTLGFTMPLLYFTSGHSGFTQMTANDMKKPWLQAGRSSAGNASVKRFPTAASQTAWYNQNNVNGPTSPWVHAPSGAYPYAACTGVYPYVSNQFSIPNGVTSFLFEGGTYEVDIFTGESPRDPRAQWVQTLILKFPSTSAPVGGVGRVSLPVPTVTVADYNARFPDTAGGNSDGDATRPPTSGDPSAVIPGDVVRSIEFVGVDKSVNSAGANGASQLSMRGDLRLSARYVLKSDSYSWRTHLAQADGVAGATQRYNTLDSQVHGLTQGHGDPNGGGTHSAANGYGNSAPHGTLSGGAIRTSKPPILPLGLKGVRRVDGGPGDYDKGLSKHMDGAFGNKADEGNIQFDLGGSLTTGTSNPYFRGRAIEETGQSFFSPNRQLSSPVMFGSLPRRLIDGYSWETLLFRPDREIDGDPSHPGAGVIPDHLWLDLFSMPVVEPYAISEPFSTAGKVNMNHVLAPFGYALDPESDGQRYITRDTALRGILRSAVVNAVPTAASQGGHTEGPLTVTGNAAVFRLPVDIQATMDEMDLRLTKDQPLFRSSSQICEVDLIPKPITGTITSMVKFWMGNGNVGAPDYTAASKHATGDNMRERPYSWIYPRLTTKSNTYTVHMRCQAIRKSPNSDQTTFDEKLDRVVGEYRGSATIERYIDPNDPKLNPEDKGGGYTLKVSNNQAAPSHPAVTTKPLLPRIDKFYRYRVVNTRIFSPE